jgi:isopentenyldiphosphate isomerase
MGKIFYAAQCDETWGENESKKLGKRIYFVVDYCFFIKRNFKDTDFNPNKDEIENYKWVSKNEILDFLAKRHTEKVG